MSRKADDTRAIPLLRSHHRHYTDHGVFPGVSPLGGPWSREDTDDRAAQLAAELARTWCVREGIGIDDTIIDAITSRLREAG